MKIIIVLPAAPLPFGDTAARWFYVLLNELLERGHSVACFVVSEEDESRVTSAVNDFAGRFGGYQLAIQRFRPDAKRIPIARKFTSTLKPFSETYYAPGLLQALEKELAKPYDVLHLEQLWTGWLGIGNSKSLLNLHHLEIIDWEDRTGLSWRDRKTLFQMTRATKKILGKTRFVRAFTSRLAERAKTINNSASVWVVPFALDLRGYPMVPAQTEPVIGLFGSMHWHPSRSAGIRLLTRIWPLIKAQMPNAKLLISGWNAVKYLQPYAAGPDIELTENLPHPSDFFSRASVMLYAPSRGSGMKIKVLESMAYGVPVVTTSEGVEGIRYTNGVECEVAESDEELAKRAVTLLRSQERREKMSDAARKLVESSHSPKPVVDHLLEIYDQLST